MHRAVRFLLIETIVEYSRRKKCCFSTQTPKTLLPAHLSKSVFSVPTPIYCFKTSFTAICLSKLNEQRSFGQLPENWTIEMLQQKHSSIPYNPDIANAFFRSGYVEAWGRGIEKINELCAGARLPLPLITYNHSGYWVEFRKDIYNVDSLREKGLNERQIKAVLYVKEKGKISNSEYQKINEIGKSVTIDELNILVEKQLFLKIGKTGRGTHYELKSKE